MASPPDYTGFNASVLDIVNDMKMEFGWHQPLIDNADMLEGMLGRNPRLALFYNQVRPILEKHKDDIYSKKEEVITQGKIPLFQLIEFHTIYPHISPPRKEHYWNKLHVIMNKAGVPSPFPPVAQAPAAADTKHSLPPVPVATPLPSPLPMVPHGGSGGQPILSASTDDTPQIPMSGALENQMQMMSQMMFQQMGGGATQDQQQQQQPQMPQMNASNHFNLMGSIQSLMDNIVQDEKDGDGGANDDDDEEDGDSKGSVSSPIPGGGKEYMSMIILFNVSFKEALDNMATARGGSFPVLMYCKEYFENVFKQQVYTTVIYERFWQLCQEHPLLLGHIQTREALNKLKEHEAYAKGLDASVLARSDILRNDMIPELKMIKAGDIFKSLEAAKKGETVWKYFDKLYKIAKNAYTLQNGDMKGFGDLAGNIFGRIKLPMGADGKLDMNKFDYASMFLNAAEVMNRKKFRKQIMGLVSGFDDEKKFNQTLEFFQCFAPPSVANTIKEQYKMARNGEAESKAGAGACASATASAGR